MLKEPSNLYSIKYCQGTMGTLLGYYGYTVEILWVHCWDTIGTLLAYCWYTTD